MPSRLPALLLLGILLVGGCKGCASRPAGRDAGVAAGPRPTLRIAFLTDIKGYLEPCGCTSRPLGGVHRLGGTLDRLARDGVPTTLVAAGDLFLGGSTSASQAQQDRWQAETLVDVLNDLGVAALVPGRLDRTRGDAFLAELRARSRATWLGGASGAPAEIPLAPSTLVTLGGAKVALIGVTDSFGASNDALVEAARSASAEARTNGARLVVILSRGDRRLSRSLGLLPGVDFVIEGGLDAETPEPPTERGHAFVLEGGRQGQRLIVLDVFLRDGSPLRDASAFTRQVRRERLLDDVESRRAQIAGWERDGGASAGDLAAQREMLASLQAQASELERPAELGAGNAFDFRVIELAPDSPERAAIAARMQALVVRVNDHNRIALADVTPPPVAPDQPTYVGSETCRSCHAPAFSWWDRHPHGHAYATLVSRHHEFDLQCVGCHVTGYGRPGGSTVTHNLDGLLVNVGCEACHGPGSQHAARPSPANVSRAVAAGTCTGCHNAEHSDQFDYDVYRRRILVPGHGLPAGAPP